MFKKSHFNHHFCDLSIPIPPAPILNEGRRLIWIFIFTLLVVSYGPAGRVKKKPPNNATYSSPGSYKILVLQGKLGPNFYGT